MRLQLFSITWLLALCSCSAEPTSSDAASSDAGVDLGPNELPCDVRDALELLCTHCHSDPPSAGATISLGSRHDLLRAAPGRSSITVGTLSLARMKDATAPMPPVSEPTPAVEQLAILEAWIEGGLPAGTCGSVPAKPRATSCSSGSFWTDGNEGSELMNPGLACRGCHLTLEPERAFYFSGTVFDAFNTEDLCSVLPPSDARVELLDLNGVVVATLFPNSAGNFQSNTVAAGISLPYVARVFANGRLRTMRTPQSNGDCNSCHTEQGTEGAPGRIVWP